MNDDQTTDHDYSAFDEKHREWLIRPELELFAILSLGHGIDPRRRGEALWEFRPRYNSLKAAGSKGLKIDHSLRPELDWGAVVFLEDLLMFLRTAGPEYDWLRNFAKRWQSYAGPRGQELQPHEDVQVVAVRSRPSHRPPTLREEVLKVLRTLSSDQLSQKMDSLLIDVNNLLPDGKRTSKDTLRRALESLSA